MGEATKIQWTDHTFNPWRGCTKVHTGCKNCYAATNARRNPELFGEWGDDGTRVVASDDMWKQPIRWNREAQKAGERRKVFCSSLADVFEDRPELVEWRRGLFELIDSTPWLDWQLLTKRPENVRRMWPRCPDCGYTPQDAADHMDHAICESRGGKGHFRPNVWIGTSISDQETADKYVPELLRLRDLTPSLFLSVEPLVGPVDLLYPEALFPSGPRYCCSGHDCGCAGRPIDPPLVCGGTSDSWIDWVIVGGESGTAARPCDVAWIRSLVRDCKSADVPVFVKQLGAVAVETVRGPDEDYDERELRLKHPKGGDPDEWPEDLRVRQFPRLERSVV